MKFLNIEEAYRIIIGARGIFHAVFVTKENTVRTGNFRLHVKRDVKGTGRVGMPQTREGLAAEKHLIGAFDMSKITVEDGSGKVLATYDADRDAWKFSSKAAASDVALADAIQRIDVRAIHEHTQSGAYTFRRGAHRFIPLDRIERIDANGTTHVAS